MEQSDGFEQLRFCVGKFLQYVDEQHVVHVMRAFGLHLGRHVPSRTPYLNALPSFMEALIPLGNPVEHGIVEYATPWLHRICATGNFKANSHVLISWLLSIPGVQRWSQDPSTKLMPLMVQFIPSQIRLGSSSLTLFHHLQSILKHALVYSHRNVYVTHLRAVLLAFLVDQNPAVVSKMIRMDHGQGSIYSLALTLPEDNVAREILSAFF
jgi:hypothetical protein